MAIRGSSKSADDERRGAAVDEVLQAAVVARVSLPSDTLDGLGLNERGFDWRALNAFQAHFPIEITHDEDGHPLATIDVPLTHTPVEEMEDEELRLA